jgi:hypothetical protein
MAPLRYCVYHGAAPIDPLAFHRARDLPLVETVSMAEPFSDYRCASSVRQAKPDLGRRGILLCPGRVQASVKPGDPGTLQKGRPTDLTN